MSELPFIIVIGAGVIGLSTALRLQDKYEGVYNIQIIAENFPGDAKTIKYTSPWAGAHHVSFAGEDARQQEMDRETFNVMWKMSEAGGEAEGCFLRIPQGSYFVEEPVGYDCLSTMPDYRILSPSELPAGTKAGVQFNTLTIDTPVYLSYLFARFLSRGGKHIRVSLQHIYQVVEGAYTSSLINPSPAAIVLCLGIGARFLGGVEDLDVYPVRGQVILLRTPWIKLGRTTSSLDGTWTYIIPRRSGDCIIGGTKVDNDWYPKPRPETTADILKRSLALCPELVTGSPHFTGDKANPSVADLEALIVENGCGLRPARKGGIRLEIEHIKSSKGIEVPVLHHYGHGGYGYQSSWGSVRMALELLEKALPSSQ